MKHLLAPARDMPINLAPAACRICLEISDESSWTINLDLVDCPSCLRCVEIDREDANFLEGDWVRRVVCAPSALDTPEKVASMLAQTWWNAGNAGRSQQRSSMSPDGHGRLRIQASGK